MIFTPRGRMLIGRALDQHDDRTWVAYHTGFQDMETGAAFDDEAAVRTLMREGINLTELLAEQLAE